jgi:hypothetical protein
MEELKNIVIQTLESNGILGNLRAQLRASVFKVIDSQDKNLKDGCGFQWENPLAPKIIETVEGEMCIDIIREFLEFYRMDYTLSTFLPECSLSQEPKTRGEIENRVGLNSCNTSMPLLMHLINAVKNGAQKPAAMSNNFVSDTESDKKESRQDSDDLLWKDTAVNMHNKKSPDQNKSQSPDSNLTSLNNLPPLTQKKSGLEPLEFNPKEEIEDQFSNSIDKEKKSLEEVDKKLKEFENSNMNLEVNRVSPESKVMEKYGGKVNKPRTSGGLDEYDDDFEDDIAEDLPVEDFDTGVDKNPEFGESGVSGSQSMGMDPSVNSLDIEEYDHVERAVINSPYK